MKNNIDKKSKNVETDHEKFINEIYNKCEKTIPVIKKVEKITDEEIIIPTFNNYTFILQHNYNKDQLKSFLKHYKLKLSGTKKESILRIYCFLRLSFYITKIQKIFRGKIQRKIYLLHGPALTKRELCTNQTDFFTMEELNKISYTQFFCYKDIDDFIYGFDIISLYNLILKSGGDVKNPYNRMEIPKKVINDMKSLVRISKLLNVKIDIDIKDVLTEVNDKKSTELRILTLFQNIDSLGHYSNPIWFTSLNRMGLVKFIRELSDIWNYRAQITSEAKRAICPPNGEPFRNISTNYILTEHNIENIKKAILIVLEKIVNCGIDRDSKALGAYYVLGALTLVNESAASSIPWLFQSFSYF